MSLRPQLGGFRGPFGCGWFIRESLLGHEPEGSPLIDPDRGAPQTDIFDSYKDAIRRARAMEDADRVNEQRVRDGLPAFTLEEYDEKVDWFYRRIPVKLHRARYHSFVRYFHWLKQLKWVEFTGEEEPSAIQDWYKDAPPRRFFRLTKKGIEAPDREWSNPQLTYNNRYLPHLDLQYHRDKRKERRYMARTSPRNLR